MIKALIAIHLYQALLSLVHIKDDKALMEEVRASYINAAIFVLTVLLITPYASLYAAGKKLLSK